MPISQSPESSEPISYYGLSYAPNITGNHAYDLDVRATYNSQRLEIPLTPLNNALEQAASTAGNDSMLFVYPENPRIKTFDETAEVINCGLSYAQSANNNLAYDLDIQAQLKAGRLEIPLQHLRSILRHKQLHDDSLLIAYPITATETSAASLLEPEIMRFAGSIGILNYVRHTITLNNEVIYFPLREFEIISLLGQSMDEFVTSKTLRKSNWPTGKYCNPSDLRVCVSRIRSRFETAQPGMGHYKTGALPMARLVGYKLVRTWPPVDPA